METRFCFLRAEQGDAELGSNVQSEGIILGARRRRNAVAPTAQPVDFKSSWLSSSVAAARTAVERLAELGNWQSENLKLRAENAELKRQLDIALHPSHE